nr:hypothetical protein [Tanacetum cinerariifolium]
MYGAAKFSSHRKTFSDETPPCPVAHLQPLQPLPRPSYAPHPSGMAVMSRPPHQRRLFRSLSQSWRAVGGGSATIAGEEAIKPSKTLFSCLYSHSWQLRGQTNKTTTVVAVEPAVTTTAAPWWCWACGGDSRALGFSCSFVVASRNTGDCQAGVVCVAQSHDQNPSFLCLFLGFNLSPLVFLGRLLWPMGKHGIAMVFSGEGRYKELNEVGWWWQDSGRVWGQDTQGFGAFLMTGMYSAIFKKCYLKGLVRLAIMVPVLTRDFQSASASPPTLLRTTTKWYGCYAETTAAAAAFPVVVAALVVDWTCYCADLGLSAAKNHQAMAVKRRCSYNNRTLWCRAVMAQPHVMSRGGQMPKTTTVVAAEPTVTTTAAPWWCWACGGDSPLANLIVTNHFWLFIDFSM